MSKSLAQALAQALGAEVTSLRPIGGGDINDAYVATLAGGRRVFVKTRERAPAGMYVREAEGLAWLGDAGALRVPEVLAATDTLLALAFIAPGARRRDFDELLGRGLATLHRAGAPSFGLEHDNFIGPLPQPNAALPRWSEFYATRRLQPLVARARAAGHLSARDEARFARLYEALDVLCGPDEPPARLHGDLWSGNVHVDESGHPVLIDPAVYGGHREIDLAMLQLFGSPSPRFFAAYDEVYPRAVGHEERVALHQLYPLLVHVNLFGASYVSQLARALGRYVG